MYSALSLTFQCKLHFGCSYLLATLIVILSIKLGLGVFMYLNIETLCLNFPLGIQQSISQLCAQMPGLWMRWRLVLTLFWKEPSCFCNDQDAVIMLISRNLHKKRSEVSIKTGSTPASLSFRGQATKHTTVQCKMVHSCSFRRMIYLEMAFH